PDVDLIALRRGRIHDAIADVEARWNLALSSAEPILRGALGTIRTSIPDPAAVRFGKLPMPTGEALDALLAASGGGPQPARTAEAVAAFFATLSAEEIQLWISGAPDLVGNTDGVPFVHRIAANRLAMQDLIVTLPPGDPLLDTLSQFVVPCTRTIDPSRQI